MSTTQPTYSIKHDGWFSSSYEAVSKSAFRAHQAEKSPCSLTLSVTVLALGILAATQSARSPYSSSAPALALPALGLQLLSHLPVTLAQSTLPPPAPGPQGTEFQINTYTASYQKDQSAAALADGGFIVTWMSNDQDGPGYRIYGQRFNASGAKLGGEFQINTYNTIQESPSVAALADGGFVITWTSDRQNEEKLQIFGQRFDSSGSKVGTEFQINTYNASNQDHSDVAALAGGGFIVTWQSLAQDGDGWGIFGQRFDASGAKVGTEFQINIYEDHHQHSPSVASFSDGGFIVTWGSRGDIRGQLFDASGAKVNYNFPINTFTADAQTDPSVAALTGGEFIVTWQSNNVQDGSGNGIFGQLFDASGAKIGPEFPINTYTADSQSSPSVVALKDGSFIVTWQSRDQDGDSYGIFGQLFDASGAKVGITQSTPYVETKQTTLQSASSSIATSVQTTTMTSSTLITSANTSMVANSTFSSNLSQTAQDTSTPSLLRQTQITTLPTSSQTNFGSSTSQPSPFSNLTQSGILLNPTPSPNTPSIPFIAGISSALGALFCSLSGGLIFYLRKQRQSKNPSKDGTQLDEIVQKNANGSQHDAHYDNFRIHAKKQVQFPEENHYADPEECMKELAERPADSHYIGIDELMRLDAAFSNLSESPSLKEPHYADPEERIKELAERPAGSHYIGIDELMRLDADDSHTSEHHYDDSEERPAGNHSLE